MGHKRDGDEAHAVVVVDVVHSHKPVTQQLGLGWLQARYSYVVI